MAVIQMLSPSPSPNSWLRLVKNTHLHQHSHDCSQLSRLHWVAPYPLFFTQPAHSCPNQSHPINMNWGHRKKAGMINGCYESPRNAMVASSPRVCRYPWQSDPRDSSVWIQNCRGGGPAREARGRWTGGSDPRLPLCMHPKETGSLYPQYQSRKLNWAICLLFYAEMWDILFSTLFGQLSEMFDAYSTPFSCLLSQLSHSLPSTLLSRDTGLA